MKRFGNVLPVRLPLEINTRLSLIAKVVGITKSDALRMAINHGLPRLERGELAIRDLKNK